MKRVTVPGDKSISHRSLLFASLAEGTSRLRNVLPAGDPRSTAGVLRALGSVVADPAGDELVVAGGGLRGWREPDSPLDCGNSGTTARLLLGALAGLPLRAVLDGDASLRARPMRRVTEPLRAAGATVRELERIDRLPIELRGGGLRPIRHESAVASAQVKSALLLAGLTGGVSVAVTEPVLSRDHSERLLSAMGARIDADDITGGVRIRSEAVSRLEPLDLDVPGDFSSAAFLMTLALLTASPLVITGVGVNETRTGLLRVLARMGAAVGCVERRLAGGEPVADIVAEPSSLRGTVVEGAELPSLIDEVPVLAVLATQADGETRIEGAGELRVKESDRIAVLVQNIRELGGDADELPDGLVVAGARRPLRGRIRTHGDHRIAMAFGVLAAAGHEVEVDEPASADISFPGFWPLLASLKSDRAGT